MSRTTDYVIDEMNKNEVEHVSHLAGISCVECPYFHDVLRTGMMCGIALTVNQCFFAKEGDYEAHVNRLRDGQADMKRKGLW